MAIPGNKAELLAAIRTNYTRLKEELVDIPVELTRSKGMEGHVKNTLISVKDLVAYLVGWGELVLKWNAKKERNEAVDFPETGYKWNELGLLAQKFYSDYENEDFNVLLGKLEVTVKKLLSLVESKTNRELYEVPWYEKWTLGRMIQLNSASPYTNARSRIRKWKKVNGIK